MKPFRLLAPLLLLLPLLSGEPTDVSLPFLRSRERGSEEFVDRIVRTATNLSISRVSRNETSPGAKTFTRFFFEGTEPSRGVLRIVRPDGEERVYTFRGDAVEWTARGAKEKRVSKRSIYPAEFIQCFPELFEKARREEQTFALFVPEEGDVFGMYLKHLGEAAVTDRGRTTMARKYELGPDLPVRALGAAWRTQFWMDASGRMLRYVYEKRGEVAVRVD